MGRLKMQDTKWRTKKDERTKNAGLKMQDQMSGVKNAGPENAGPENQDRKMEDQWPERVFCSRNMSDCVVLQKAQLSQRNRALFLSLNILLSHSR